MNNKFIIFEKIRVKILAFTKYIAAYGKAVKDGYISNAYSPLVWLIVLVLLPLGGFVIFTDDIIIKYVSFGLIILIILFALVMYVVLLKKDPRLLQSEWYRLEDKRLNMIAEKGDTGEIVEHKFTHTSELSSEELKDSIK